MFSSKTGEWETPQWLFDELYKEFHFTQDVCATEDNSKCLSYWTKKENGLNKNWDGLLCWMNPPYGREIGMWVKKASEATGGVIVCLLPARTDTKWFHEYIYKKPNTEVRFIKGRLKFGDSKNSAPFPSMIVIFR